MKSGEWQQQENQDERQRNWNKQPNDQQSDNYPKDERSFKRNWNDNSWNNGGDWGSKQDMNNR